MTTTIFVSFLIGGAVGIFFIVSFILMEFLDSEDVCFGVGAGVTALFILLYANLTPSTEQMIENDYYAMLKDRPNCIDSSDVSLGCKKEYIDWQKDSIEKQHKYDSVKVKLENLIIKTDTAWIPVVKTDIHETDSVKTCIDRCWAKTFNADIKQCQDECFK